MLAAPAAAAGPHALYWLGSSSASPSDATAPLLLLLLWPLEPVGGVLPWKCTPQEAHTAPLVLPSPTLPGLVLLVLLVLLL